MGRFFTNVHVRPAAPSSAARAAIASILDARAAAGGLHAVQPPDRVDRLMAITSGTTSRWITVADEVTESQDLSLLEDLAKSLSRAVEGHVVSVLVHDSDVLDLMLFERGRRLDHFVSQPDFFSGALTAAARRKVRGDARLWAPLLEGAASVEALEQAFRSEPLFAEDTLAAVARLLGFANGYDVGANDLRQEAVDGFELLYFAGADTDSILAGSPPRFSPTAWTTPLTLSVGEGFRWSAGVMNTGGPVHGVAAEISGAAIERGLVHVTRMTCAVPLRSDDVARSTIDLKSADGRGRVEFPGVLVPADASGPLFVALEGSVAAEGRGPVVLRIEPLGEPANGCLQSVDVSIGPALPRPLRAQGANFAQALRDLQTPATLVAVAALRMPRERAAQLSSEALLRWIETIAGGKNTAFSTTVYDVGRPKHGRFSSKDLAKSRDWLELCETMARSGGVYAQTRPDLKAPSAAEAVMGPTHGFAFHVSHLPQDVASLAPHLAFWFDIRNRRPDDIERVRVTLTSLVDDLVRTGHVYQAFMARWDWRPALTLHATPYELACGVHGQCTTQHAWTTRFLHAVAETVWLGASFVDRLSGFQAPDGSMVEPLNGSLRVTCGESRAVSALERALADFLPSHDDWKNEVLSANRRS